MKRESQRALLGVEKKRSVFRFVLMCVGAFGEKKTFSHPIPSFGVEGTQRGDIAQAYRETGTNVDVEGGLVGINLGVHVSPDVTIVIREIVVTHRRRCLWESNRRSSVFLFFFPFHQIKKGFLAILVFLFPSARLWRTATEGYRR